MRGGRTRGCVLLERPPRLGPARAAAAVRGAPLLGRVVLAGAVARPPVGRVVRAPLRERPRHVALDAAGLHVGNHDAAPALLRQQLVHGVLHALLVEVVDGPREVQLGDRERDDDILDLHLRPQRPLGNGPGGGGPRHAREGDLGSEQAGGQKQQRASAAARGEPSPLAVRLAKQERRRAQGAAQEGAQDDQLHQGRHPEAPGSVGAPEPHVHGIDVGGLPHL
mmetsp:Transcript_46953/g.121798  ORF Transcript_46953/g.121798 Transcript_46953/m.121798 type:complete len:223 (+) Transcript_46953:903-1571(+)